MVVHLTEAEARQLGRMVIGTRRKPRQLETPIHKAIVGWCRNNLDPDNCIFWHTPSGGRATFAKNRHAARKHDYDMGVLSGVADLIFWYRAGEVAGVISRKFLFVEVKEPKGDQSESQIEFERFCVTMKTPYEIARSVADMEAIAEKYSIPMIH